MSGKFGVHIGNSVSCLCLTKDGKHEIVANQAGDRVTPAIISVIDESETLIGLTAKQMMARNVNTTVVNNKQFLNSKLVGQDFEVALKQCSCKIISEPNRYEITTVGNYETTLTPIEVNTLIMRNIYSIATHALSMDNSDVSIPCVLSAPLYFSKEDRQKLVTSAKDAGFQVLQIISDPAAALLAYDIGQNANDENCNVLVYRMGGVTVDATLMKVNQGVYEVLGYIHDNTMGGKQMTDLLVEYIAQEFFRKYKLDPRENRRTMIKLSQSVENSKHILSAMETVHVFVESLMDGIDFALNVSRARFENLIVSLLPTYTTPIQRLFEQLQFKGKVDKIVFCGGSMRIPKLQATIAAYLPDAEVYSNQSCDEVIALGCAKQAALLVNAGDDYEFLDMDTEFDTINTDIYAELIGTDDKKLKETCLFEQGAFVDSEKRVKLGKTDDEVLKLNIYERIMNEDPKLLDSIIIDEKLAKTEIEFMARIKTYGIEIDFVK